MLFATIRGIWGCDAATAEKLRSLANGRNWNLVVLEMDATSEASANETVGAVSEYFFGVKKTSFLLLIASNTQTEVPYSRMQLGFR